MSRRYWLLKSDPDTFGWHDLERAKHHRAVWDGVRNYQARNILRDGVRVGDGVLFYHSGADKAVIGTCRVVRGGFPDPTDGGWIAIEIEREAKLAQPVTLDAMRGIKALASMALLRRGNRLSVQPVTEGEWRAITGARGGRRPKSSARSGGDG